MLNGFTLNFKPLDILTENQIDAIERGFLAVLEETGMKFYHKKVLEVLKKGGCKVDYDNMVAKFPPSLVLESIRQCPSSFRVKAREAKNDLVFGANKLYFSSNTGMQRLDLETGELRDATRKEFYDALTIYDALENLHCFHPYSPHISFAVDPIQMSTVETFAAMVRNSSKVNYYAPVENNEIFSIQIAQATGVDAFFGMPSQPPLACSEMSCAAALRGLDAGFPMTLSDGHVYGATAPVTLAGALVHGIAEISAKIVFVQLYQPGTRVLANAFTSPQNMKNGAPFFGNIAVGLYDAAFNQIWRRYRVPTANIEPGLSSSKCIDFQNGYERSILALISALSGCNYMLFLGSIYGELSSHPLGIEA